MTCRRLALGIQLQRQSLQRREGQVRPKVSIHLQLTTLCGRPHELRISYVFCGHLLHESRSIDIEPT
jgi:hypothetical protein